MSEPWLLLNNKKYNFTELRDGSLPKGQTSFEKTTLQFCRDWLNNQETVTVATSGSTGAPKKINFTRTQLVASARLTEQALGLRAGYTALLCLDPDFIAGKMMIVRALVIGMNIIAVEPSANPLSTLPTDLAIDFGAFVPYQLQSIIASVDGIEKMNHMKAVIVGGAATGRALSSALRRVTAPVYATYGMTETLTHIALQRLSSEDAEDHFTTLSGVTIALDERGCLTIQASHLGANKIVTNDLAEELSPTRFRWLGRWDTIINTGGVKVVPEKIEARTELVLAEMGLTNRFFISGWPDEQLGNKVVLIIEGEPLAQPVQIKILASLHDGLSRFEVPKEIKFILHFEETDTQKINRIGTLRLGF